MKHKYFYILIIIILIILLLLILNNNNNNNIEGFNIIDYNKVNNFNLEGDNYLYLDIFARDNNLFLLCQSNIDVNLLSIKYNDKLLSLSKQQNLHENIIILIYEIEPINKELEISVSYKEKHNTTNIIYEDYSKINKKTLSITTLFKDDYYLIPIFIEYYKKQGVEHFYLYYNKKLSELKLDYNILSDPNITFIEWDYLYWFKNNEHNAQPAQINHFIYKYGKPLWKYTLFSDLDEYAHIKNSTKTLFDLVNSDEYTDIDTFKFNCVWADTIDKKIPCKNSSCIFPNQFNISTTHNSYRAKLINKLDSIISIKNIHEMYEYNFNKKDYKIHTDNNNMLFHFFRWSGPSVDRDERTSVDGYDNPILYNII